MVELRLDGRQWTLVNRSIPDFYPGVAGSTPVRPTFFRIPLPHRRNNLYLYAKHRVGQTGAED